MSEVLDLQKPTFEQVPEILAEVRHQNRIILSMLKGEGVEEKRDRLFNVEQLSNHLPEKPARQTIYGWVNQRKIPFEKHGANLFFRESKIEEWQDNGRQMP
nr:helix-turn-helix domain-containing protein [uncultured Draconibacterium sp.]